MRRRHPALRDFPVCLQLEGRRALVVGAGEVATRRIVALLEAGARVTVVAPEASAIVRGLAASRSLAWRRRCFRLSDLRDASVVFAATSDRATNRAVAKAATKQKVLVNACDDPAACTFTMPAVARRGALSLAVSTGGTSPATAARVRDALAESETWTADELMGRTTWQRTH
ncbi:MAG: bifunctional precorrin-2 dehydrogenase/sirohydrochlorin ferrochelatase [Deltaproteobacteria bacterium]|nr:bifunctional precorrin-2 dehydrogenase/sirohydrochlorin ferrochelatase [Deltaproteobacteria bacterium]